MPDGAAPLAFIEKSHCVPILLTLYKNGMMNRNQLYSELGQTINIVIKRINFLIISGLIKEYQMKVRPFAKYIDLTPKGLLIADLLEQMNSVITGHQNNYERRVHIIFDNKEVAMNYGSVFKLPSDSIGKFAKCYSEIFESYEMCPHCQTKTHLLKKGEKYYWLCFNCGNKKVISELEAKSIWLKERNCL